MALLGEMERTRPADLGVVRFITAGSVDDGKSTLIGRLLHDSRAILADQMDAVTRASNRRGHAEADLSLLTDGLEAEREQGITIDVAYRYFATSRRKFIIADTPGHEQYTRNMATGASTADAVIILIDARKGVLAQTRRHSYIAHLLGIRHVFVAINKMDLVGYEYQVFEEIRDNFKAFAGPLGIPDLRFFPISALRGDNIVERGTAIDWYQGPTLLDALEGLDLADRHSLSPRADGALRFPVQFVVRNAASDYRAYAGRIEAGTLITGQQVVVLPSGRSTTVREIRLGAQTRTVAVAGDAVTLRLADDIDLARGDLIAAGEHPPRQARTIEATLVWLSEYSYEPGARLLLKHGTRTVKARISGLKHRIDIRTLATAPAQSLQMNDIAVADIATAQPIFFDSYAELRATGAFILIDETSNQTVAAGMIHG